MKHSIATLAVLAALALDATAFAAPPNRTNVDVIFALSPRTPPDVLRSRIQVISNFVSTPGLSGRFSVCDAYSGHRVASTNIGPFDYDTPEARRPYLRSWLNALDGFVKSAKAGPAPEIQLTTLLRAAAANTTHATIIVWGDPRAVPQNTNFSMLPNRVPSRANLRESTWTSPYGLGGESEAFQGASVYLIIPSDSVWTSDRLRLATITWWRAYLKAGLGCLSGLGADEASILAAARAGEASALLPDVPYDAGDGRRMVAIDDATVPFAGVGPAAARMAGPEPAPAKDEPKVAPKPAWHASLPAATATPAPTLAPPLAKPLTPTVPAPAPVSPVAAPLVERSIVVRVSGPTHGPVSGLTAESFRIRCDGEECPVVRVSTEEVPSATALVLDTSGSMRALLPRVCAAAATLIKSLPPADTLAVYSFTKKFFIQADFTTNRARLLESVASLRPGGGTHLMDAVCESLARTGREAAVDKSVVIITDDGESASEATALRAKELAETGNVRIFLACFRSGTTAGKADKDMMALCATSGGEAVFPRGSGELETIVAALNRHRMSLYHVTYRTHAAESQLPPQVELRAAGCADCALAVLAAAW